jgi:hypothetical protein
MDTPILNISKIQFEDKQNFSNDVWNVKTEGGHK